MGGPADTQVLEEHLVQLVVVVLAGVHQDMVAIAVELGDHSRQARRAGPGFITISSTGTQQRVQLAEVRKYASEWEAQETEPAV